MNSIRKCYWFDKIPLIIFNGRSKLFCACNIFRKYDNAEQDDLWRHLTEAAHEAGTLPTNLTVKTIMDTWTLQMGYPVIKVERSDDGTSATVSQVSVCACMPTHSWLAS